MTAQPYRGSVLKPEVFGEPKPIQQAAPLFTGLIAEHPGLQEEIAQQPLTEEQITHLWEESCYADTAGTQQRFVFARAIERAHGISQATVGKNK